MKIPHLQDEQLAGLSEQMGVRPRRPFIVSPKNYYVVDGDTLGVQAQRVAGASIQTAFRIRFCSVNAAEKPFRVSTDADLLAIGIDPNAGHPGNAARDFLKAICKGRSLLVFPGQSMDQFENDAYGRLLAEVCVSGARGEGFTPEGAHSVQHALLKAGHAKILSGSWFPEEVPDFLEQIKRSMQDNSHDLSP